MKTYIAENQGCLFSGGWMHCINWGVNQVKDDRTAVIKIYAVRAGEKQGCIVTEISKEGTRQIKNGRYISVRKLQRMEHG